MPVLRLAGCGKLCGHTGISQVCTSGITGERSRRMLKKARLLTRPTLARRDAPGPKQGRSVYHLLRGGWDDPNCARPTSELEGRALREHRDRPRYPLPLSASC